MIYMLLQSGMFRYMLGQLHACYMILHAFTVDSMQLQALDANPVEPYHFKIVGSFADGPSQASRRRCDTLRLAA